MCFNSITWPQACMSQTAGRSWHKRYGVIQYQRSYFATRCPKWIFIISIILVENKHTKSIYHMLRLYQYSPLPFHRSYKNWFFFYNPPLNNGGPEIKCTCFHRNSWKKLPKMIGRMASYIEKLPNNRKNDPLNRKEWNFLKISKSSISYGTRFSQPKYHIPRWKTDR